MNCAYANLTASQQLWDCSDEYIAAAIHGFADAGLRQAIETMLFRTPRSRIRWARAVFVPPSILSALARFNDHQLNRHIIRNGRTPLEALRHLRRVVTDEHSLGGIAAHRNASADLLATFRASGLPVIRFSLAGNPSTPADILEAIALDASKDERRVLAGNPGATERLLGTLWHNANDDEHLRAEIAAHPRCPDDLLPAALGSSCDVIRRKLASNPNVTHDQLVVLLSDPVAAVRVEAIKHIPACDIDESDPAASVRKQTARRVDLSAQLVARLANDECAAVRRWLARNPSLDVEHLALLSKDAASDVRRSVARNVSCPQHLLRHLATDKNPWVRAGVSFRADLEADVMRLFAHEDDTDVLSGIGKNPAAPGRWLKRIAASENADLRRAVILNPNAPSALLRQLSEDPYAFNRITLVEQPTLPMSTLLALLSDPEPQVRFMAATRLARTGLEREITQRSCCWSDIDAVVNLPRASNAKENSYENTCTG